MTRKNRFIIIFCVLLVITSFFVIGVPPSPHGISGTIYLNNGSQVPLGTHYYINDTTSSDFIERTTYFPIPGFSGYYSETIEGNDGDTVIIRSWIDSFYGETTINLSGDMTGIDVTLNMTRKAEPVVFIITPVNNTERNTSSSFEVKANITIFGNNATACNATISFSNSSVLSLSQGENYTNLLENISLGNTINTSWILEGIWIGNSNITITTSCFNTGTPKFEKEDDTDTVSNITIIDTSPPNIILQTPYNNTWSTTENISFNYTVEEVTGLNNCSIYLDNNIKSTEIAPNTFENLSFTVTNIAEGYHNWSIQCFDSTTNKLENTSELRLIKVDTIAPNINLFNPLNDSVNSENNLNFEYNVTEQTGIIENCSLIINSIVENITYNISSGEIQNISKFIVRGQYNWNVSCYDSAGNLGESYNYNFTEIDPDLEINSANISFNPSNPVEDENVQIIANIFNTGDDVATNIIVQFFLEDPNLGGTQIGVNHTISSLGINQNETITQNWTSVFGLSNFFVIVDPPISTNGSIIEINENNNKANKTLFIPLWNIYFGNVSTFITLASGSGESFINWETNKSANIFVVETGTVLDWSQLQSLGRKADNSSANSDFEESDQALNITGKIDSINNTYTENFLPVNTINKTIFSKNISFIPIVNSTNNSFFITGILWDISDGGLEYNGSQDLIFYTESNKNKTGKYGVYDYEIKIPAQLDNYKYGGNSVDFYTELT